MIATGTGIAPLHGMLQQRAEEKKEEDRKEDRSTARTIGKTILFFGCSSRKDYLYGNSDLKEWERLGILEVYTAFSSEAGKVYVQEYVSATYPEGLHLILQQPDLGVQRCRHYHIYASNVSDGGPQQS